ncbi:MAG: galactitol-1-phosphate 5-dehydrogenase [Lachnospiraceae bacterium]|nr:galactitol-1-phosphate 5-dehydrogenase [Lachnospiraceae bacterium]
MAKAWVLHEAGNISLDEVIIPDPLQNEVRIRVMAAGICGSDIPRIYKTGAHKMPLIPGHEFSGVVDSVGEGVDPLHRGKRVGVYPLIPCGECGPCREGSFELCRHYDYVGSRRDGAFAEYVTVPVNNLIELPDEVSFEEAAMLEPMAVAVNAVKKGTDRFSVGREKKITIIGMGTIGLFVAMFLKEAGYNNIYVTGNKEGQQKRAESLGIDHFTFQTEDISEAYGSAVVFECVGKSETIVRSIEMAGPFGRVTLVGNPYGDVLFKRDQYWKILRDQLTVSGVWNSRFNGRDDDDWHYVLDRLKKKRIDPRRFITHRLPLDMLENGFLVMRDKKEDYCKVMMAEG